MQRPDERKRTEIMRVAARMFAERQFHEVTLDEIAARARLGKGTIYVYFASKDDLYETLVAEGMEQLTTELRAADRHEALAWPSLERAVAAMFAFADRFPHLYTLMRSGKAPRNGRLARCRAGLSRAITGILRHGARSGEVVDPRPALTAEFVLGSVRAALLFGSPRAGKRAIARHLLRVLGRGVLARNEEQR
jgi:AcrR family transcriptional regulator